MLKSEDCDHDYEHPIRLGRAHWICKDCKTDISLLLVLMADLEKDSSPPASESEDLPS